MTAVLVVAPFVLVALVLLAVHRASRRPAPLCRYERSGDEVTIHVDLPWWLAYARTRTARVADVTSARVMPAGERARLLVRVCGVGWPGFYTGWFRARGGMVYVARRVRHDALDVSLARGRVRRWLVEVEDPAAAVADLTASGVPSATPAAAPTTRR
jgi:hypothetical protein